MLKVVFAVHVSLKSLKYIGAMRSMYCLCNLKHSHTSWTKTTRNEKECTKMPISSKFRTGRLESESVERIVSAAGGDDRRYTNQEGWKKGGIQELALPQVPG